MQILYANTLQVFSNLIHKSINLKTS